MKLDYGKISLSEFAIAKNNYNTQAAFIQAKYEQLYNYGLI